MVFSILPKPVEHYLKQSRRSCERPNRANIPLLGTGQTPIIVIPHGSADEGPSNPSSSGGMDRDTTLLLSSGTSVIDPGTNPTRYRRSGSAVDRKYIGLMESIIT
jgi:hypothetical protein